MADSSSADGDAGRLKVWTFIIKGGQPTSIEIKGRIGPGHHHDGGHSVWKIVGTVEDADAVEALFTGPLVGATVQRHTEDEDDEMRAIRKKRLGLEG